jgi:hypothetical protein
MGEIFKEIMFTVMITTTEDASAAPSASFCGVGFLGAGIFSGLSINTPKFKSQIYIQCP